MFGILVKYHSSFFSNVGDIKPTPDVIIKFMEIFKDKNLLPSNYTIISIKPETRLRLGTSDSQWVVDFDLNRIMIQKNMITPTGDNLGNVEQFCDDIADIYGKILSVYPHVGARLALVTEGITNEMSGEKLDSIYRKIINPLPYYDKNMPYEWSVRHCSMVDIEISGKSDKVNVVTRMKRQQISLPEKDVIKSMDRLVINLEVNTDQNNSNQRFDIASIKSFNVEAMKIRQQIIDNIGSIV